ncbi:MAG: methyltransferase domain-containing protein [Lachnospiraceae bacterium]|nr:methyltransferase domain-containing protein [Lachnospiraceae bacterium]
MKKKDLYTTGELAKLTGVSYKTIRHYYEIGLLIPEKVEENKYKKFGQAAVEQLQKILMLKYLDFSLEEIGEMLKKEERTEAFAKQAELLKKRKAHLELILQAVEEIQSLASDNQWEKMLDIIRLTTQKEELEKQYAGSDNLQKRINIHAYSTSKVPWFAWVLEGLELKPGMKILELGCGTGALWVQQRESLPENLEIVLTDSSEGMLESAREAIRPYSEHFAKKYIRFYFQKLAAEDFIATEEKYDRVIANHMLYHVADDKRPQLLENCAKALKKDGMFYASTVGCTHMREMFDLQKDFDSRMNPPGWFSEGFELENGGEQLKKAFVKVVMEEQENDLLVPDPEVLYHYIESLPGNNRKIVAERGEEFRRFLEERISPEKPFFCHKSTGAFRAFIKE